MLVHQLMCTNKVQTSYAVYRMIKPARPRLVQVAELVLSFYTLLHSTFVLSIWVSDEPTVILSRALEFATAVENILYTMLDQSTARYKFFSAALESIFRCSNEVSLHIQSRMQRTMYICWSVMCRFSRRVQDSYCSAQWSRG